MIPVAEIFGPTIQGEGPHVGIKTLFVRVVGCNFNCEWCDSKFAWKFDKNSKQYTPEELANILIDKCKQTNTSNVVLTGGNPCLYDFETVLEMLFENYITVDVETQGTPLPQWLLDCDKVVISPKAPSSKQPDVYDNVKTFLERIDSDTNVCIKIPVFDEEDFKFAERYYNLVDEYRKKGLNIEIYLSVGNDNVTESGDISNRILNNYHKLIDRVMNSDMKRVFILPQVHTLVWGNKQGV
nr:MAG TPA: 7-cyano-7-deazaguanosine biosynthesis protein [Caudoviricetes sp.]